MLDIIHFYDLCREANYIPPAIPKLPHNALLALPIPTTYNLLKSVCRLITAYAKRNGRLTTDEADVIMVGNGRWADTAYHSVRHGVAHTKDRLW